jgi:hypothetical protein
MVGLTRCQSSLSSFSPRVISAGASGGGLSFIGALFKAFQPLQIISAGASGGGLSFIGALLKAFQPVQSMEIRGIPSKPSNPFKFNPEWLFDETFHNIIKDSWVSFSAYGAPAVIQFASNFKNLKQVVIPWVHEKRIRDEKELSLINSQLEFILHYEGDGHDSIASKEPLKTLEFR